MNKVKRAILITAIFTFFLYILSGCIGVDTSIEMNDDGSGVLTLSYRISRTIALLGELDDQNKTVPLPVNREDFNRSVLRNPGITLNSYTQSENEEDVFIDAEISFNSIKALNEFLKSGEGDVVVLQNNGGISTLTYTLFPGTGNDLSEENVTFLSTVFADYGVTIDITVPSDIESLSPGMTTTNARSASVTYTLPEILESDQEISWEIAW